jgi:hypothetical protein
MGADHDLPSRRKEMKDNDIGGKDLKGFTWSLLDSQIPKPKVVGSTPLAATIIKV